MRSQDVRAVQGDVTVYLQLAATNPPCPGVPAHRFGCDRRARRAPVLRGVVPRGTGRLRPSPGIALGRARAARACPRAAARAAALSGAPGGTPVPAVRS